MTMARMGLTLGLAVAMMLLMMTTAAQKEQTQVDSVCPPHLCPLSFQIPCERYKRDENGCLTCQCLCYKFSLQCPYDCKYGTEYAIDANGCKICQCASKPVTACPGVCRNFCPFGRVYDENNCPTCRCLPPPPTPRVVECPPVCMIFCQYGNVLDENGCPTCTCNSGQAVEV